MKTATEQTFDHALAHSAWQAVAAMPQDMLARVPLPRRFATLRDLSEEFRRPEAESAIPFINDRLQRGRYDAMHRLVEATRHSDAYLQTLNRSFSVMEKWILGNPILCNQIHRWSDIHRTNPEGPLRWIEQLYTRAFEQESRIKMPKEFGLKLFSEADTQTQCADGGRYYWDRKEVHLNTHPDAKFHNPVKAFGAYIHELTHGHGGAMADLLATLGPDAVQPLVEDATYFLEQLNNNGFIDADLHSIYWKQTHEEAARLMQDRMESLIQKIIDTGPSPVSLLRDRRTAPAIA